MPPGNPAELGPFTVFVLLKVNPGAALIFGDADLLVEAGVEVLTEVVVDMEVMAEVVAFASVLEAAILTAGFKPPTVDAAAFSFMSFEKSNLKPPGELAVVLLVTALNWKGLPLPVAEFMPQFNVALGGAADCLSLLFAVPKIQTAAGLLSLAVAGGEANGPTLAWVLLAVNMDPNTEFEVAAVEVELLAFTV
jgi:hypothetical protein